MLDKPVYCIYIGKGLFISYHHKYIYAPIDFCRHYPSRTAAKKHIKLLRKRLKIKLTNPRIKGIKI